MYGFRWGTLCVFGGLGGLGVLGGCDSGGGADADAGGYEASGGAYPERQQSLAPCVDSVETEDLLVDTYMAVEGSVHELITCGGAQFDLMASLVPQILASNEDLLQPEVRTYLGGSQPPFTPDGEGGWVMNPAPGTTFTVEFLRAGAGPDDPPIKGNLFRLEQYFAGLRVTDSPSGQDLLAAPDAKHDFALAWDGAGPLGDLLPAETIAAGQLTLAFTVQELQQLFMYRGGDDPLPDIGPFVHLLDLPVRSRVVVEDTGHGPSIRYSARGPADEASDLLRGEHVPFIFDELVATEASGLEVTGTASDLEFRDVGLAGTVDYAFTGRGVHDLTVVSDFGEGASYPQSTWSCDGVARYVPEGGSW